MDEDRDLLRRLKTGEAAALRRIYEKYKDDLLTVGAWIAADVTAAEDCLHDLFVTLAARSRTLDVHGTLRAYLVTGIANRARDHLRRRARQARSEQVLTSRIGDGDNGRFDPPRCMIDEERVNLLHRAIAELPAEQRVVITLRLHGEMTFEEIAEQEGVSNNTIRSRYRYGLDKLRSSLTTGVER